MKGTLKLAFKLLVNDTAKFTALLMGITFAVFLMMFVTSMFVGVFTHSDGNETSRRIAEKLGFSFEGVQRGANVLPGGKHADRHCYARFDIAGLPDLEVQW